jgi:hypothetical protein
MTDTNASSEAITGVLDHFATHSIKAWPPYFAEVAEGRKPFEVRKNDRGYQRGDLLIINEWHPEDFDRENAACHACRNFYWEGHYTGRKAVRWVTFVYTGDPRFTGIEPGHVVLALAEDDYTKGCESA